MKSTLVFQKIKKIVEALLFAAKEPLEIDQISKILNLPKESLPDVLSDLTDEYSTRGIRVLKVAHGYIFGTDPDCAEYVDVLRNFPVESRLSHQALETLSIIAYKQPTTKPEIERIRGVFSDGVIETLINKKLIEERGRDDGPGRPILYGTTTEFLKHFGLKDTAELPPLPAGDTAQPASFDGILVEKEQDQQQVQEPTSVAEVVPEELVVQQEDTKQFPEETLEIR
ncbi:MAG: SMC-Scp complex subunit ScpB [Candidatus Saganbacteria bacterium]|nr:SMC-Scp complex subunit ScpB [Candidatus Saganbacteria bacterium]